MGVITETLRTSYPVERSLNPGVSFIAYGDLAAEVTGPGTELDGVEPIRRLMDAGGDVLLMGVTHTNSTAIHLGEKLAGRDLFIRYALTRGGPQALESGGCGRGFDALQSHVEHIERKATAGRAMLRTYPLQPYIEIVVSLIRRDPCALLCSDTDCGRCNAHRSKVPS
jgi:aminoglycoside 3-N-acetyltransferase